MDDANQTLETSKLEESDNTAGEIPVPVPPTTVPFISRLNRPVFLLPIIAFLIISTGTVFFLTRAASPKKTETPVTVKTQIIPTAVPTQLFLTLENPQNGDGAIDGEILVSGKTLPGATIAIYTGSDQVIIDTDSTGTFKQTVVLDPGVSTLTVSAFSDDGQEQVKSVDIQQT